MVNSAKDKGWRNCPINESTYIDGVLKEAREDNATGTDLVINSVNRIRQREKKDEHRSK
jgi:hypothetical protein